MKKIIMIMSLFIVTAFISQAQEPENVTISASENVFSLNIAGYQIGFSGTKKDASDTLKNDSTTNSLHVANRSVSFTQTPEKKCIIVGKPTKSIVSLNLIGPFYHGWNTYPQSEYYGDWSDRGDFLKPSHSFSFGMSFCRLSISLNRERSLKINMGGRWDWTRSRYDNYHFFNDAAGHLDATSTNGNYRTRVFTSYLGFPVGLSYRLDRFKIEASISAEWLVKSYARVIKEKGKTALTGYNPFRSTVELMVSYGSLGAYVQYGITPMLAKGMGNDVHTLTIGFVFDVSL